MRTEKNNTTSYLGQLLMLMGIAMLVYGFLAGSGCTPKQAPPPMVVPTQPTPTAPQETPAPSPSPTPADPVQVPPAPPAHVWVKISWEKYPENFPWTDRVAELIRNENYQAFDGARDAERFCPAYRTLPKEARVNLWTEVISQIALYESAWKPTSRMQETTMGTDPVTGKPVWSEGLLQLSYQDIQWAPYCEFDWKKDKLLSPTSPQKTILDPIKNLECGVRILAAQIRTKGTVILNKGVYWAVLKEGGKYQKIAQITGATKKMKFCEVKK